MFLLFVYSKCSYFVVSLVSLTSFKSNISQFYSDYFLYSIPDFYISVTSNVLEFSNVFKLLFRFKYIVVVVLTGLEIVWLIFGRSLLNILIAFYFLSMFCENYLVLIIYSSSFTFENLFPPTVFGYEIKGAVSPPIKYFISSFGSISL